MLRKNVVLTDKEREALGEIRQILIERAKVRGTIPYSELVEKVQASRFIPRSSRLAHMLGLISKDEVEKKRGMLTAVVVGKNGPMEPGRGFYKLAKSLNRGRGGLSKCWARELRRIYSYWRDHPNGDKRRKG